MSKSIKTRRGVSTAYLAVMDNLLGIPRQWCPYYVVLREREDGINSPVGSSIAEIVQNSSTRRMRYTASETAENEEFTKNDARMRQ